MTSFSDGPAKGQILELRRAPIFLRVTTLASGKCDALDQIDDKPMADEHLFAYRLTAKAGMMHIFRRGGGGGWQTIAEYRMHEPQPTDAEMRTTEAWRRWTEQAVRTLDTAELAKLK
jgi:hypothetical protein